MGRAVAFFGMLLIVRGASTEVLPFSTRSIYVHTYFIRRLLLSMQHKNLGQTLTWARLSPRVRVWPARLLGINTFANGYHA